MTNVELIAKHAFWKGMFLCLAGTNLIMFVLFVGFNHTQLALGSWGVALGSICAAMWHSSEQHLCTLRHSIAGFPLPSSK